MSATDDLLSRNAAHADSRTPQAMPAPPRLATAIVTCMDARINLHAQLGLQEGDAHVIRNAGGAVTSDAIRSLAISQRKLGTREILVIHHTGCGMQGLSDEGFRQEIQAETGIRPEWSTESFADAEEDVRQSLARIRTSPFIPFKEHLRGFVLDVETMRLREVSP